MSVDYKYKPDKHKFRVNHKSIDELHKEHLDLFKKSRESIAMKKNKLKLLENEHSELELINSGKPINLDIDLLKKRNNLRRNINIMKEEINKIENYNAEMDYYSRAGDVVYDYYDLTNGILYGKNFEDNIKKSCLTENKTDTKIDNRIDNNINNRPKNKKVRICEMESGTNNLTENKIDDKIDNKIDEKENNISKIAISDKLLAITNLNRKRKIKKPVRKRNKKIMTTPNKGIMSFLLGSDEEKEEDDEEDKVLCRAALQNEYLIMMDKEYACSKSKTNLMRKCKICGIDEVIVYNESILSCPKCGESDEIFIESEIPSHTETFNEKPKYPYKRKGHCVEKLNQFLCKGTANIPPDVFNILEEEIEKHGLTKKNVTIKFLEKMLQKHRLSDYYEYIMFIYSKITNTPPQTITREDHERVLKMFEKANEVYEKKFKPKNRNNFLKYTFVLSKIFLTIGKKNIAKYFKLLKSPVKMKEQERIWQLICAELDWKYCSS